MIISSQLPWPVKILDSQDNTYTDHAYDYSSDQEVMIGHSVPRPWILSQTQMKMIAYLVQND